jgi:hypothetical protein
VADNRADRLPVPAVLAVSEPNPFAAPLSSSMVAAVPGDRAGRQALSVLEMLVPLLNLRVLFALSRRATRVLRAYLHELDAFDPLRR